MLHSIGGIYFADENAQGGVYGDTVWKSIRLVTLALIEVVVALKVNGITARMMKDVDKRKVGQEPPSTTIHGLKMTIVYGKSGAGNNKPGPLSSPSVAKVSPDVVAPPASDKPTAMVPAASTHADAGGKLKVVRRLSVLGNLMIVSAICMLVASVFIFLNGYTSLYPYTQSNPYLYSFIYNFPWWLLQVSSVMEVRAVEEIMRKS